jgi:hypothetical protein
MSKYRVMIPLYPPRDITIYVGITLPAVGDITLYVEE